MTNRDDGFRHLDPTTTKIYQQTTVYGFELLDMCFILKVRNGYVCETPWQMPWIRGQHIDTLAEFFTNIKPLRIAST